VVTVACPAPADEFGGLTSAELAKRMIDALQVVETVRLESEMRCEWKQMDKLTAEIVKEIFGTGSATRVYDMVNKRMREITRTTGRVAHKGIVSHIDDVRVRYFVDGFHIPIQTSRIIRALKPSPFSSFSW
jgi:hypothetical protein